MIYITGDCHGDWRRFRKKIFYEQDEMTRGDYVIVAGDFGIWADTKQERHDLDELSDRSFTTLFVDGNHENYDRLYGGEFEEVDFCGGRAHKIRDNIYHLMRGYVFAIDGRKVFAFGGASSHDIDDGILDPADFDSEEEFRRTYNSWRKQNKMFRVKGVSWWPEEMPFSEEMERGLKNLEACGGKVDFVVAHSCPSSTLALFSMGVHKPDGLTKYFEDVAAQIEFGRWFFGHYHKDVAINDKYLMLYEQIVRIN